MCSGLMNNGKTFSFIFDILVFLLVPSRLNDVTKRFDQVSFFSKVDSFRYIGNFYVLGGGVC